MMNRFMPEVPLPGDRNINNSIFNAETSAFSNNSATLGLTGDPRSAAANAKKNNAVKTILQK